MVPKCLENVICKLYAKEKNAALSMPNANTNAMTTSAPTGFAMSAAAHTVLLYCPFVQLVQHFKSLAALDLFEEYTARPLCSVQQHAGT